MSEVVYHSNQCDEWEKIYRDGVLIIEGKTPISARDLLLAMFKDEEVRVLFTHQRDVKRTMDSNRFLRGI